MEQNTKFNFKKKVVRYSKIYGFGRTYVKIAGRLRKNPLPIRFPISILKKKTKNVAIIGCGQFAFATISYFLKHKFGDIIFGAFDVNESHSKGLVKYYKGKVFTDAESLIKNSNVSYVYIASNHATHTDYAIKALNENKIVYVEKPISVTKNQLNDLILAAKGKQIFVGYNRPFSPAIQTIKPFLEQVKKRKPLSLNCFITGHKIPKDHWYRNFDEGTRVCGNIGHWLDLSIHLLAAIGLPSYLTVSIHASSKKEKDDNLNITLVSDREDIISIMLSSREEPFEGINETINLQHAHTIAKIDDFRRLTIWNRETLIKKRYFRKDAGHKNAILQPFNKKGMVRNFDEVIVSTQLMLEITEAIRSDRNEFVFNIN